MGPMKYFVLFLPKFLACASLKNYGKKHGNFPGSPRYDAKHGASDPPPSPSNIAPETVTNGMHY